MVDHRFISGLSPGREARVVPGCRTVQRHLFVSVNPVHARHVREKHRRHVASTSLEKHEQAQFYVNRRSNKISAWPAIYQRFTCRIQNPDIPRASRVGAPGGAAARGRARLDANRTIHPGNKDLPYPPKNRINDASTSRQKHEEAKSYVINRWRNKISG